MINILLMSNSIENVNVAWRHFCYSDYNASATTNIEAAMENLKSDKASEILVFYCGEDTDNFYPLYNTLRSDPDTRNVPLLVLADVSWQMALTGYVKFYNMSVLGISVNDEKLRETVRFGAKYGFEDEAAVINRPPPKRPAKK